jgi:hypothetical protein
MFISADTVFNDVKQMLSTYDANGLLGEPDFFRWTRFCMNQLGTFSYKLKEVLIPIENYKAPKPEDFKLLKEVYICSVECEGSSSYRGYLTTPRVYTISDYYSTTCYDKCDVCYDGNEYVVKQVITKDYTIPERKISSRLPLAIDRRLTADQCSSDCINRHTQCEYTFNLTNDEIITSFQEGWITFKYYALPTDEEGYPLILDEPLVEKAVEDYLIYKSFQKIYYNNEADVLQRMQYAEQQSNISMKEMILYSKTDSWRTLIDYAKKRNKGSDLFNLESDSDYKPRRHARI